ncbi:MAG TPA: WbuC family cupin fold metalloprotein [Candidatus Nanoarchaeia archaeon]|nr:WbuC family cupin fold metalloprotein [Candidatus Nanoarchaeia archaeon]
MDFKKVLILGHKGFVGKHLEKYFKEQNQGLTVLGLDLPEVDLTKEESVSILQNHFDSETLVIMCSGIKKQQGDNLDIFLKNVAMAVNVSKALEKSPVSKFLFFSSSEVYGTEVTEEISEETSPRPTTYYGLAKIISEQLLGKTHLQISKSTAHTNSSLLILRPALIYGPGDQPCYGPSGFVKAALSNETIVLWGDGTEKREFVFVEDIAAMVYQLTVNCSKSSIFNAAAGKSYSFSDIVDILSPLTDLQIKLASQERSGPKTDLIFSNKKLLHLLPSFSFTPLSAGLQKTLEFQRHELDQDPYNSKSNYEVEFLCRICQKGEVKLGLNFGLQPISTRFLQNQFEQEYQHRLSLGTCNQCALVQLLEHPTAEELKPRYSWITYLEPEGHLDNVAETIEKLLEQGRTGKNAKIAALSYKDDSLLERMRKKGFNLVVRLDPSKDLGINDGSQGTEAVQGALNSVQAKKVTEDRGKFDLLIVRHILEHVYAVPEFLNGIKELLSSDGLVLFEVPDYSRNFESLDYSSIWEEHLMYFTPDTFQNSFVLNGFSIEFSRSYPYTMENCLVAVLRKTRKQESTELSLDQQKQKWIINEKKIAANFFEMFPQQREKLRSFLSRYRLEKGNIAVFGAGHTADLLINVMGLQEYLSCIIDDNENKKNLFMPGSRLPIKSSAALLQDNIKLGLFCLNPDLEEKIMAKNKLFLERGGKFLSLSPASKHFLFKNAKNYEDLVRQDTMLDDFNYTFSEYNKEVYYPKDKIVQIGKAELEVCKLKAEQNERKRSRICAHTDKNDTVHEMLIALGKETYIRPHKHLQKPESFHVIEGSAKVIIFDEQGKIKEVVEMGDYQSHQQCYYRLNGALYHTVIITSPYFVFHETTKGPFEKEETIFASWSPEESDTTAILQYQQKLQEEIQAFLAAKKCQKDIENRNRREL